MHRLRQIATIRSHHFNCGWSAEACGNLELKQNLKIKISMSSGRLGWLGTQSWVSGDCLGWPVV